MSYEKVRRDLIYVRIIEQVKLDIASGRYPNGTRLPSVRRYAKDLGVNPNTVQKALVMLEDEGILFTKRTAGRFVTNNKRSLDNLRQTLADEEVGRAMHCLKRLGYSTEEMNELVKRTWRKLSDDV
ncbi:MAG: GntR family transcriptional regulator [Eubacteriales bacterium]|nr:GntR family transcriptional regulator [Eubacteriales bacterium]